MIHTSVRPAGLSALLDDLPSDVRYLSLDCFDTLLWRNVHKPVDIFAELPLPGATELRINAESAARHEASLLRQRGEVTLDQIYEKLLPETRAAERQTLLEAELAAEARHACIFAPVRDLIIAAKQRGLTVIIVSDTYLDEERLRTLIARAGGSDVLPLIDRIFCSCAHGVGKASGLFATVLAALGVTPEQILHVGDNPISDQRAPTFLGIHTAHLVQFDGAAEQRLRQEAGVMALLDPDTRGCATGVQAHRPQVACRTDDEPCFVLGHDVLGPILHAFAVWLHAEAEALNEKTGKAPKLLFLLRDGYMPARAFAALYPAWKDRVVLGEISRFAARGASFVDGPAIQQYLIEMLPTTATPDLITRQLLFDADEQKRFIGARSRADLVKKIVLPFNREKILKRSAKLTERLCAHLRAAGIEDGDTVMVVDTGYNGSVQNMIEPVLRRSMNLALHGRYFLLCEHNISGLDKKGLFDLRNYSTEALRSVWQDISILEKLCASPGGSVIDYERDGTPIRAETTLSERQDEVREAVQRACLDYLAAAHAALIAPPASADADGWRRTAFGVLGRLIFLPSEEEAELFSSFELDVNQGTQGKITMLDAAAAATGMKRRGLSYMRNGERVYQAAELRRLGLPYNLSMLAISRFGLDVRQADLEVGGIRVPITLMDGGEPLITSVEAHPTADGFYRAVVPVGAGRYTVGIRLGMVGSIVQVEESAFLPISALVAAERDVLVPVIPITDGLEEIAPGVYRSPHRHGFMLLLPPPAAKSGTSNETWLLSFVFRPIVGATGVAATDSDAGQEAA